MKRSSEPTAAPARRSPWKTPLRWGLVLAVVGLVPLTGACSSLSKVKLEERLLSLEKNAAFRDRGLVRGEVELDLGDGPQTLETIRVEIPRENEADGARLPVVLVHGTPSTLFTWTAVAAGGEGENAFDGLGAARDTFAVELIGHGIGPDDLAPYSFESCAQYLGAAVRELGVGPVHLVGNSYGGEFCWRMALNEPDLVASLTLISSSGIPRRDGDWLPEEVEMRENGFADYGWLLNSRDRIMTALEPHFREVPPDQLEEFFLVCDNSDNWEAMIDLARDEEGTRAEELRELQAPTLLLWGEDDIAYPRDYYAKGFEERIPDVRLQVLPGTGHYPQEEIPAVVVTALEAFFGEVEARNAIEEVAQ